MANVLAPLPAPTLAEVSFSTDTNAVTVLTDPALQQACGLRIAFTGRSGGVSLPPYTSLNLGDHVGDDLMAVTENRELLMDALCIEKTAQASLINPNQVHGDEIITVGDDVHESREFALDGADGIVCSRQQIPVLLCFADCVSVILAAPSGAFAVLHAGWRGALAGIPGKGLAQLAAEAGCAPEDCNAYIGPHIGACCYETSQEILDKFIAKYGEACDAGSRHLDLTAAVTASLVTAGASADRIVDAAICTSCHNDTHFSYRADGGITGRHGALAYLA